MYYLENDFNKLVNKKSVKSNFSLLHVNPRSLYKNITQLTDYLKDINYKFSILAVSETWANEINSDHLVISGYNRVLMNRIEHGGGVAIFVDDKLSFKQRPELNSFVNKNFECVFIEITDVLFKNRIVATIYRPPDTNLDLFMIGFESVLNILSKT